MYLVERRLHLEGGGYHVEAPVEIDVNLRAATARDRTDAEDARDGADRLFGGPGHLHGHPVRRPVARVELDPHAGEIDAGKEGDGHHEACGHAAGDKDREEKKDRLAVVV